MKPFCDICWKHDGKDGMVLQRCKDCGVHVHNECYGIEGQKVEVKNENFTCWACKAVGKTIKVRERDPNNNNERLQIHVTKRPTECMLCSVDDGDDWYHAMHPIYDDPGLRGRQIVLSADGEKPKRLGWGHSLCCFSICAFGQTKGCVYGVTQDGKYNGDDDEGSDDDDDDDDSDNSINSFLDEELDDPDDISIHHFVYVLSKHEKNKQWALRIREQQNSLTCTLCGKSDQYDRKSGIKSYRIPVQCCVNDKWEYPKFKLCHKKGEVCGKAMHIGCAFWKKVKDEYPSVRRVFFFPGLRSDENGGQYSDTVVNIYCLHHARRLQEHNVKGTSLKMLRYPYKRHPLEAFLEAEKQSEELIKLQRVKVAERILEKRGKQNENYTSRMYMELVEHFQQLSKKAIREETTDFDVARSSVFNKWKEKCKLERETFAELFNKALKRARRDILSASPSNRISATATAGTETTAAANKTRSLKKIKTKSEESGASNANNSQGTKKKEIETTMPRKVSANKSPISTDQSHLAIVCSSEQSKYDDNGLYNSENEFEHVEDVIEKESDVIGDISMGKAAATSNSTVSKSSTPVNDEDTQESLFQEIVIEILAQEKMSKRGKRLRDDTNKFFETNDNISCEAKENQDKIFRLLDNEFDDNIDDQINHDINTLLQQYKVKWQPKLSHILRRSDGSDLTVEKSIRKSVKAFWCRVRAKVKNEINNTQYDLNSCKEATSSIDWSFLVTADVTADLSFPNHQFQDFDSFEEICQGYT